MGSGLTDKQIGERLCLSQRTVDAHLYQISPELGITSRAGPRDTLVALPDDLPHDGWARPSGACPLVFPVNLETVRSTPPDTRRLPNVSRRVPSNGGYDGGRSGSCGPPVTPGDRGSL